MEIQLQGKNAFNLVTKNKVVLSDIEPFIDNTYSQFSNPKIQVLDSNTTLNFSFQDSQVGINVAFRQENKVAIVSISSNKNNSSSSDGELGITIGSIPNYVIGQAAFKYGSVKAWTRPMQIKLLDSLEETDNQFFIWQYADSSYGAAMPLLGEGYVSTIGKKNGKLAVRSRSLVSNYSKNNIPLVALAFGNDPFEIVENLYKEGMKFMDKSEGLRKSKVYPPLFENLMWCTWNSFGHTLDEKQVIEGMYAFKNQGISIPTLLLDDGWSIVSAYGTGSLQSFKTQNSKFPTGFKPLVNKLKTEFGVKEVGVWHAFNGYWAGIDPSSELGIKYKKDLIPYLDRVAWSNNPIDTFWFINPKGKAGFEFYNEWHTYLKNEGISFLKVDNQLVMDRISKNNFPFSETAENMQRNLQSSVKKHFDGAIINCMDMTTDAVYNYGSSAVARSSEDFFPDNTSYNMQAGNAAVHVVSNVCNSLWWSQLVWSDFDMFQTHHPNAEYHAIARAISGGPIYITDTPGKTNISILQKLITTDGKIIRSDRPVMPTRDCLFQVQDPVPFKVQSISNNAGLLAIFNVADADMVTGSFVPENVYQLKGSKFLIYDYFNQTIELKNKDEKTMISLPRLGYKLFFVIPIEKDFAAIGNVEKYNAPKTIKNEKRESNKVEIELIEAGGIFKAYALNRPTKIVSIDGSAIAFEFVNNLISFKIPVDQSKFTILF